MLGASAVLLLLCWYAWDYQADHTIVNHQVGQMVKVAIMGLIVVGIYNVFQAVLKAIAASQAPSSTNDSSPGTRYSSETSMEDASRPSRPDLSYRPGATPRGQRPATGKDADGYPRDYPAFSGRPTSSRDPHAPQRGKNSPPTPPRSA